MIGTTRRNSPPTNDCDILQITAFPLIEPTEGLFYLYFFVSKNIRMVDKLANTFEYLLLWHSEFVHIVPLCTNQIPKHGVLMKRAPYFFNTELYLYYESNQ